MANNINVLVFPVKDLDQAKTFYGAFLGTQPYADAAYYVGYKVGDLEVGLVPSATDSIIAYTDVDDIRAALKAMTDAGAEVVQEPKDVAAGLLVAQVKDASGNVVGFRQQP